MRGKKGRQGLGGGCGPDHHLSDREGVLMSYVLGRKSLQELDGVKDDLRNVVFRAIQITRQDFSVHDGLRTQSEQSELVRRGASTTMNSKHLTGDAVDLVPYINGKLRWEWGPIYKIAAAVSIAAKAEGVALRWGGVWDRALADLPADYDGLERAVAAYVARRKKAGKRAFIDGPHFEIIV